MAKLSTEPVLAPDNWPRLESRFRHSAATETAVAELLALMPLEQKVAQLIKPEIGGASVEDMRRYGFGSVLNAADSFPQDNPRASVDDWLELADQYYRASLEAGGQVPVPCLWGTNAVHGHNNLRGATLFPHNIALGATGNPELVRDIAAATAREVAATGVDWVFAPGLAVVRDCRWGRTYESYGEDPQTVSACVRAFVTGLQRTATGPAIPEGYAIATARHFIGAGATRLGRDQGDSPIAERELLAVDLPGFSAALQAGAQAVMVSFNSWHGRKMQGNRRLLTDILMRWTGRWTVCP